MSNNSSLFLSNTTLPTTPSSRSNALSPTRTSLRTSIKSPVKSKSISVIKLTTNLVLAPFHVKKVTGPGFNWSWLHCYEYARYLYCGLPESAIVWPNLKSAIGEVEGVETLLNLLNYLKVLGDENGIKVEQTKPNVWNQFPICESLEEMNAAFKLGKIHFTGDLKFEGKQIVLKLNPASVGSSNRHYRKFGSDRFFRLRMSEEVDRAGAPLSLDSTSKAHVITLRNFLQSSEPLIIFGRRFRPYCVKEKAILYWCEGGNGLEEISLCDFCEMHLQTDLNGSMKVAKYISRLELGLTSTTSTIEFTRTQVIRIPDLLSDSLNISYEMMKNVVELIGSDGERFPPGYVPSAIAGHYFENKKKIEMVWRLDYNSIDSNSKPTPISSFQIQIRHFSSTITNIEPKSLTCTFNLLTKSGKKISTSIKATSIDWVTVKPESIGVVMTDGCCLVSPVAMRRIRDIYAKEVGEEKVGIGLPSAAQGRVGPAKGVWAVANDTFWSQESILDDSESKKNSRCWIEVRESQWKYNDSQSLTFPFEVHSIPSPKDSANLGKQLFEVLGDNGVPVSIIKSMLRAQLKEMITCFTSWDNNLLLLRHIETQTSLFADREFKAKVSSDPSMLRSKSDVADEIEYDESLYVHNGQLDPLSGAPNTLPEVVASMLQAGFSPNTCPALASKIVKLAEKYIRSNVKFNIECSTARTALVVSDYLGILKEGELFYQPSKRIIDKFGKASGVIDGPVLISRSPTVQPCDVQRYQAVYIPEFRHIFDLIILPSVGARAACGVLSGGDYDGDKLLIITDSTLVNAFNSESASPSFADPPFKDEEYFEIDSRIVSATVTPLVKSQNNSGLAFLLVDGFFQPSRFGILSKQHTKLAYMLGLHHPSTSLIGHLYAKALDGKKQGYTISEEVWNKIQNDFNGRSPAPAWTFREEDLDRNLAHISTARRELSLGIHVMDVLVKEGLRVIKDSESYFNKLTETMTYTIDPDGAGFWESSWEIGIKEFEENGFSLFFDDLCFLLRHVKISYDKYKQLRASWASKKNDEKKVGLEAEAPGSPTKSPKKWTASSATAKEALVSLTRFFWSPILGELKFKSRELLGVGGIFTARSLMASCAYLEPLQSTPLPKSYVPPVTTGNLFSRPSNLSPLVDSPNSTSSSHSPTLRNVINPFNSPSKAIAELTSTSDETDLSPFSKRTELVPQVILPLQLPGKSSINLFLAQLTEADTLDVPQCSFAVSSPSSTPGEIISIPSSPEVEVLVSKPFVRRLTTMDFSSFSGKDTFVLDMAHADFLALKADAQTRKVFGATSTIQARKLAPEILHALSVSKRNAGVDQQTKKYRPQSLLPPTSSSIDVPSPSKKSRIA